MRPVPALPPKPRPPPTAHRYFSRWSQSRLVRQKTRHCAICSRSASWSSSSGLSRLVASERLSLVLVRFRVRVRVRVRVRKRVRVRARVRNRVRFRVRVR